MTSHNSSSIRRTDLFTLSNLRSDGRKTNEIRSLQIQYGCYNRTCGQTPYGTGSACIEMGCTTVLAMVRGPIDSSSNTYDSTDKATANDECVIDVTVQLAAFADPTSASTSYNSIMTTSPAHTYNNRSQNSQSNTTSGDKKLMDIATIIHSVVKACVITSLYPQSLLQIHVLILQDDGNKLCTCINAVMCAIYDANIPTKDICCACTAGYSPLLAVNTTTNNSTDSNQVQQQQSNHHGNPNNIMIDLNSKEEFGSSGGNNSMIIVPIVLFYHRNTIVYTQCGEYGGKITNYDLFEQLMEYGMIGCRTIGQQMITSLREYTSQIYMNQRKGSTTTTGRSLQQQQQYTILNAYQPINMTSSSLSKATYSDDNDDNDDT